MYDKQIFADNLRFYMDRSGISRADLCEDLGLKYSTVTDWVNGKKFPRMDKVEMLAQYFGILKAELIEGGTRRADSQAPKRSAVRVPVYGRIPAGIPMEAIEDVLGFEELGAEYNKMDKEYFALEIKGDSMSPKYQSGDIVIFERTSDCENGEDCAVRINGDDATFKKVRKQTDGIILQPLNADYAPITVDYANPEFPIEIIGVAKEIRRKL